MIYSFSLFYGLLSGLGSLLSVFCFLCFNGTSALSFKLHYTEDEPYFFARANIHIVNEEMCLLNSTFVFN